MNMAQEQFRLGMTHLNASRVTPALSAFQNAARLAPRAAPAHHMSGVALQRLGRLAEADAAISRAIALAPREPDFLANRSLVRSGLERFDLAIADAKAALGIAPEHVGARCNLGLAEIAKKDYVAATRTFLRLLKTAPEFASGRENLLLALRNIDDLTQALEAAEAFVSVAPSDGTAWTELGEAHHALGNQQDAVAAFRNATRLMPDDLDAHSLLLFAMNAISDLDSAVTGSALTAFGDAIRRAAVPRAKSRDVRAADKQLRLGFVSGDLREHSVSHFLLTALPALRARGFELVAYQTRSKNDAVTERLRPMFDAWHDISEVSDEAAADLIELDAIDILFDLAGHTAGRRQRLFGLKPAPVSIAWLGYSASTGNPSIDYILCNDRVLPPAAEGAFTERPLRMAGSYLCFSPMGADLAALENTERMMFGSFNTLNKLSDRTVALWSRILQAVPDSGLTLKARAFSGDEARSSTAGRFARHGISPDRLTMIERSPDRSSHLALYSRLGMALDPWPYSGTTTTMEALSMGVPVLTMNKGPFISRVSASLLEEAGLTEWIAADEDEYVAKAVAGANPEKLAQHRSSIRNSVTQSRLYDAAAFAADFDATVRQAWRRWCTGAGEGGP